MTTLVRPSVETIAWITNKPTEERKAKRKKKAIKQVKERNKNIEELAITQRE